MAREKKKLRSNSSCINGSSLETQSSLSTFDENVQEALDNLFAKEQQTYEEFLNSFMYLKKDDVLNNSMSSSSNIQINGTINDTMANQATVNGIATCQIGTTDLESDELLSEEIGHGNVTTSILLRTKDSTHGRIQLDNFVDDQSLETGSIDCYQPSVCEIKTRDGFDTETTACTSLDTTSTTEISLPGERELDCDSAQISVHLTYLNITTQKRNPDEITMENKHKPSTAGNQEKESCEVKSFHLDEDFDYDNIQVTPKFDFLYEQM